MEEIRTLFFGSDKFAIPILEAIINNEQLDLLAVVTQPDKEFGRKRELVSTDIKNWVSEKDINIQLEQPEKLRTSATNLLEKYNPELIIVTAYGQIVPKEIIDYPRYKCINLHGSLLPEYRGAVPIEMAIKEGRTKTGVSLLVMTPGLDDGEIIAEVSTTINDNEYAIDLRLRLAELGAKLFTENINGWITGDIEPITQEKLAEKTERELSHTWIKDMEIEERQILQIDGVQEAYNKIRAFSENGAAWWGVYFKDQSLRFKIFKASPLELTEEEKTLNPELTGVLIKQGKNLVLILKDGKLILEDVQLPGKQRATGKQSLYLAEDLNNIQHESISIAAIPEKNEGNVTQILLIHHRNNHYGLIKGHIEPGESELETLHREVEEETGMNPNQYEVRESLEEFTRYGVERDSWKLEQKTIRPYKIEIQSSENLGKGEYELEWISVLNLDKIFMRNSDREFLINLYS